MELFSKQTPMKLLSGLFFLLLFIKKGFEQQSVCTIDNKDEGDQWNHLIPEGYRKEVCPQIKDQPTTVYVGIYPQGIPDISIEKMTFDVDFYVSLMWMDCRLNITANINNSIAFKIAQNLWTPNLSVVNGVGAKPITFLDDRNIITVLNGNLNFHLRKHLTFYCIYDLTSYPMDQQICQLELASDLEKEHISLQDGTFRQFWTSLEGKIPPQSVITHYDIANCSKGNIFVQTFSCIAMFFVIKRPIPYHLIVTYVPSVLIVILSWVSFWLDVDASAPRVTLGLTSLLTLTTQFSNTQKNLPPVSYIKAIDVWMFACMFMVFASLIQFAIANFLHRRQTKPAGSSPMKPMRTVRMISTNTYFNEKKTKTSQVKKCNYVDKMSRIIFPFSFIIFVIFYWVYYLYI